MGCGTHIPVGFPLRATGSLGTVEPVSLGDIVLLDANPLDDIHHTEWIEGVVLERAVPLP